MISEIIIPDLGATGADITLDEWLVQTGDSVTAGQPLFSVTTDKATVEIEAFRDGVVRELRVEAGVTLPPGSVVAVLADSMAEPLTAAESNRPPSINPGASSSVALDQPVKLSPDRQTGGRILASPLARRMAETEGIALASLTGTGTRGQILKRDVVAALNTLPRQDANPSPAGVRRPLSPMRQAIAERTVRSKNEAPHFYAAITIDMSAALDLRLQAVDWAERQGWVAPTMTDLCISAAALTLREFPALNASFADDGIITYSDINIGLIVGLDEGMLIPVIHQADRLNLYTLAETTLRIKQQADAGRLSAGQLQGGTFTLSNLGMFGLDSFTAVLNPPEAGILALGAVKEQAAVVYGELVPRPLMKATLSVDHRVVDGIMAARFAQAFKDMLENPVRLTLGAPSEAK